MSNGPPHTPSTSSCSLWEGERGYSHTHNHIWSWSGSMPLLLCVCSPETDAVPDVTEPRPHLNGVSRLDHVLRRPVQLRAERERASCFSETFMYENATVSIPNISLGPSPSFPTDYLHSGNPPLCTDAALSPSMLSFTTFMLHKNKDARFFRPAFARTSLDCHILPPGLVPAAKTMKRPVFMWYAFSFHRLHSAHCIHALRGRHVIVCVDIRIRADG